MVTAHILFTERKHGDFADVGAARHPGNGVPPSPWTWLRQVHGASVVVVRAPGDQAGVEADGAVTAEAGCALVVRTADCAPVMLSGDGAIGIAHAGWRGLLEGVVEATAQAMRDLEVEPTSAWIGPCIQPADYEFGVDELEALVSRFGPSVRGETRWGTPALDVPASVRAAAKRAGIERVSGGHFSTAAESAYFSHRLRGERERMATIAWMS